MTPTITDEDQCENQDQDQNGQDGAKKMPMTMCAVRILQYLFFGKNDENFIFLKEKK